MKPQEELQLNWNSEVGLKKYLANPVVKANPTLYKKVQSRAMELVLYRVSKRVMIQEQVSRIESIVKDLEYNKEYTDITKRLEKINKELKKVC